MDLTLLYFGTKLTAYTLWMFIGLQLFRPPEDWRLLAALSLGTFRLLMGFGFGLVIWFVGTIVYVGVAVGAGGDLLASAVTYLSVYAPVRWVEWGIFEVVLGRPS